MFFRIQLPRTAALSAAVALALVGCGGGGSDGNSTTDSQTEQSVAETDASDETTGASGQLVIEFDEAYLVWALDGERVGDSLDYDLSIPRDRFDAGLDMVLAFRTGGDPGDVVVDGGRRTFVNGEQMDGNTEAVFGPEQGSLRTSGQSEVDTSDDGFELRLAVGRPVSPTSLIDLRDRAVDFDLDPDSEQRNLLDLPPIGDDPTKLSMRIERFGEIRAEFAGSLDSDDISVELLVTESPAPPLDPSLDCAGLVDEYIATFEEGLADADNVFVARERRFDHVIQATFDQDCDILDFDQPVCAAAQAVTPDTASVEAYLERHLDVCPAGASLVDTTVIEPTVTDGVLDLTVPLTQDGLPAFSVVATVPNWEVIDSYAFSNRLKLEVGLAGDRDITLDFSLLPMPETLMKERIAERLEPTLGGTELVEVVDVEVADLPAQRLVEGVGLATTKPTMHTSTTVALDAERLLTIDLAATSSELQVTEASVRSLVECIERSIVVVEFDRDSRPTAAEDCTALGDFAPAVETPPEGEAADDSSEDAAEPGPGTSGGAEVVLGQTAAVFDGAFISLAVPARPDRPAHVVRVASPAWELDRTEESESSQSVDLEGPESFDSYRVSAGFVSDYVDAEDSAAEPLLDDWSINSDTTSTESGRSVRIVTSSSTLSSGAVLRIGQILTPLDANRLLQIRISLGVDMAPELETELAAALASLTIETSD